MRRCLIFATLTILFAAFLSSCAYFGEPDRISGGEKLDEELLSEIREEIFGSDKEFADSENEKQEDDESEVYENIDATIDNSEDKIESEEDLSRVVFWSNGGSVWHTDKWDLYHHNLSNKHLYYHCTKCMYMNSIYD